ncbi:hypothetical protein G4B88_009690 [Cannabis sativa]|uniref:Retrotransposon Copia-like N-terminal domain-containing protein n=1 Tax=Cannabis sativa TaxID=3483 RepID=A0A7J6GD26_CANSA|nr:hypothetical protein G4B88_009690 [Cannabis sativa]
MARTRATGSQSSGQTLLPHNSSNIPHAPPDPPVIPPVSNITGDNTTQQTIVHSRPVHEDSSSPYYLNSGDHPGLTLVSPPLLDKNIQPWRPNFELSVGARNKTGTQNGTSNVQIQAVPCCSCYNTSTQNDTSNIEPSMLHQQHSILPIPGLKSVEPTAQHNPPQIPAATTTKTGRQINKPGHLKDFIL